MYSLPDRPRFIPMSLFLNIGIIYYLIPFVEAIDNKFSLLFSILIGSKTYKVKTKGHVIKFKSSQFQQMMDFIAVLMYSVSHEITSDNKIRIKLDFKNEFVFPLDNWSLEDENLIRTLFFGTRFGANFETKSIDFKKFRDKTLVITENNGKKIIETSTGIKFYMDSIHPGNTIGEAFVQDIHTMRHDDDFTGKIVLDVGAECGDTALYYASKGATVFAFEPVKAHYDAMIRNLSLNSKLAEKITPINAAIGKDGKLKFYHSNIAEIAGVSSFVYNAHGKDAVIMEDIQGYTVSTAMKEFNIPHIDLLKEDCKGCEFFLTEEDLEKVDQVKIEYESFEYTKHNTTELTKVLDNAGFEYVVYRTEPTRDRYSTFVSGHLFGTKIKSKTDI
jgi:FkbM family methyltransferase